MQFTLLHTMIRVLDLDASLKFYTELFGMRLLRKKEYPEGKFTLAFLGYGDEATHTVVEFTHNWDRTEPYTHGDGFGHLALGVSDIYATCDYLRAKGAEITREPGAMKAGTTVIAFLKDPDGYLIELIQKDGIQFN